MLGSEHELKALWPTRQIALCLLRDTGRSDCPESVATSWTPDRFIRLADDLGDRATVQTQTRQQGNGSQPFIFVVPGRAGMPPGYGRPVLGSGSDDGGDQFRNADY